MKIGRTFFLAVQAVALCFGAAFDFMRAKNQERFVYARLGRARSVYESLQGHAPFKGNFKLRFFFSN